MIGAFGAASIIGAFVFGWPSIIAVIINYVKRSEVRGTYLDSHFSWQIRTFWWALLLSAIIAVLGFTLAIVLIGFAIWIVGFFVLGIWAIYRIARGWLALMDRRPMPPSPILSAQPSCSSGTAASSSRSTPIPRHQRAEVAAPQCVCSAAGFRIQLRGPLRTAALRIPSAP